MKIAITLFIPSVTGPTESQQYRGHIDTLKQLEPHDQAEPLQLEVSFIEYRGGFFAGGTKLIGFIAVPPGVDSSLGTRIAQEVNRILVLGPEQVTWHMTTLL